MTRNWGLIAIATFAVAISIHAAEPKLDALKPGQKFAEFATEAVYDGEDGSAFGARFRHRSGFVLDLLRIQSLPQSFVWVNSPPPSDQGTPHTLEHLLLLKGTKGQYVSSLEDMSMATSSAFTQSMRTCYHFNTAAGTDTFFTLFHEKLDAMLHPTFSDEEIRREVCNMGVKTDGETGKLILEEKGAVYNEMLSTFERPWSPVHLAMGRLLFGPKHAFSYSSGGTPAAIRTLTPAEIRVFHKDTHRLSNMGAVVALPKAEKLKTALARFSKILDTVSPDAPSPQHHPDAYESRLPPFHPAPTGEIQRVTFPHANAEEPGVVLFAWPANKNHLSSRELLLLQLFSETLASGQSSLVYDLLINSETRKLDVGANKLYGWTPADEGMATYVGIAGVNPKQLDDEGIKAMRSLLLAEITRVAALPDGSAELKAFNDKVASRLSEWRKWLRDMLGSPPKFGYRGDANEYWHDHFIRLHKTGGFRRSVVLADELAFAEAQLAKPTNAWRQRLADWQLATVKPYAVAAIPDPTAIATGETERKARVAAFIAELRNRYAVDTDAEAVARYKTEYDAKTVAIDKVNDSVKIPPFVKNPPLSYDETLDYRIEKLPGGGELVVSTFESMTGAQAALALDLYSVPASQLLYLPSLPLLLREGGLHEDGKTIAASDMEEQIRRELLSLEVELSSSYTSQRAELLLRAGASQASEVRNVERWLQRLLTSPDLRPENLPRIRDLVTQQLSRLRDTMKEAEEKWVNFPARAFRRQRNPLFLTASCFLTQTHAVQRLKWRLLKLESPTKFAAAVDAIAALAENQDAVQLRAALEQQADALQKLAGPDGEQLQTVIDDLKRCLADLPPDTMGTDWQRLCATLKADAAMPPEAALADLASLLNTIKRQAAVRGYVVASPANQKALLPAVNNIVRAFPKGRAPKLPHRGDPIITRRVQQRHADAVPIFVHLLNENTRGGVHIHTADTASFTDTSRDDVLGFLASKLYGGGGVHGVYMKTSAAGLAYSNGLGSSAYSGRLTYYAERCPDLAQTMKFVVDQLKAASHDDSLGEYAVSLSFKSRSGDRYEQRTEFLAADLANGMTPKRVTAFSKAILRERKRKDLAAQLFQRLPNTTGLVLPGYGTSAQQAAKTANAIYFTTGPSAQLDSWQQYVRETESLPVYPIYPSDYWLPK